MSKAGNKAIKVTNCTRLERWNDGAGTKRTLKRARRKAARRLDKVLCEID